MERLFYRTIVANNGGRPMVAPTNIVRFLTVTVGTNCVRPPLFTIIAYFRAIRESPLRSGMKFIVGSIHESTVFVCEYSFVFGMPRTSSPYEESKTTRDFTHFQSEVSFFASDS